MKSLDLRRLLVLASLAVSPPAMAPAASSAKLHTPVARTLTLPMNEGSVRFAVIGDTGTGAKEQYDVANQMAAFHEAFPFTFVLMLGDNIYGSDAPAQMARKFSTPYKTLLGAGVQFRAALGNHDNPTQRFYTLFNMGGERYYTFRSSHGAAAQSAGGGVSFFALDTDYLDKTQLEWLERQLASTTIGWKIAFFHHPLYSSGGTHGSALEARALLEPLFLKYGVCAAFSGHDHFYERIKPQKGGIQYWVSGAGGRLRKGDLRPSALTAKGFDTDNHFLLVEISGDELHFQAISRTGSTIDSGVFHRPTAPPPPLSAP